MQNKKLTYKINLTPFELFNTVILLFMAVAVFFGVLWMGGTLIGSGGMSCDTYYTKYKPMIIISESMTPTIAVNSLLFVEDKAYSDLEIGDIILFNTAEHGLVGHRIVEQVTEGFKTKGDNNELIDNWVVTEGMYKGCITEIHNEFAPIITLLFGDLDNLSVSKLLLGFVLMALFLTLVILIIKGLYEYVFLYHFLKKSSIEGGGKKVIAQYYPYLERKVVIEDIEEVFEKLGKKVSFLDSLCLRYRVLKLHRILLEEDRYKQRCLWQIKKIGKDLR